VHRETTGSYNIQYIPHIPDAHWIIMKSSTASLKLPAKKTTNITLSMDVYQAAKSLGINISQVCEQRLREEIQLRTEQHWNQENADFLVAYNRKVEEEGLALEEWRSF
jgi:antitoxin CcdA